MGGILDIKVIFHAILMIFVLVDSRDSDGLRTVPLDLYMARPRLGTHGCPPEQPVPCDGCSLECRNQLRPQPVQKPAIDGVMCLGYPLAMPGLSYDNMIKCVCL